MWHLYHANVTSPFPEKANMRWVESLINQWYAVAMILVVGVAFPARADVLLSNIDFVWNPATQSTTLDFGAFSNLSPPAENQVWSFNVGVRVVPTAGATGSLRIESVSVPTSNAIFANYAGPPILSTVGNFQVVNGENAQFANVPVPSSGVNLFRALLVSPNNDASGRFQILADPVTSNYFTVTNFDGFKFGNVPDGADPNGVVIGSITAVPEPCSIGLIAAAGLAFLGTRRKRS